jgi:hypothetical protein
MVGKNEAAGAADAAQSLPNLVTRDTPKIALPVPVLSAIACPEQLAGFY